MSDYSDTILKAITRNSKAYNKIKKQIELAKKK